MKFGCKFGYGNTFGYRSCADKATWKQGDADADAKQDTAFLGKSNTGTLSELAVDRSQFATDMTVGASGISQSSPGSQFQMGSEWTCEFLLDMNSSTSGLLAEFDFSGGWIRFGLGTSGGVIEIARPDTTLILNETNDVVTGTTERVAIGFAALNDPDPTGERRVFAYAQNRDTGACRVWYVDTGAVATITNVDFLDSATAPAFAGGTCRAIRFSHAFHSATETFEDLLYRTQPVTRTAETRIELLAPSKASGMGDDGQFAGPVHSATAAGLHVQDLKLAGPLINEIYNSQTTFVYTTANATPIAPERWFRKAPGTTTYWMGLPFFRRRPVPSTANRVRCRVFIEPDDAMTIGVMSMSRRPGLSLGGGSRPPAPLKHYSVAQTTAATAVFLLQEIDLGYISVAREETGMASYFVLLFSAGVDVNFRVRAWILETANIDTT